MNKSAIGKVLIPALLFVVVLVVLMPRSRRFGREYQVGKTWDYETLVAQFDFPLLKTESQLKEERLNAVSKTTLYFKYSEDAFSEFETDLQNIEGASSKSVSDAVSELYSKVIIADNPDTSGMDVNPDAIYVQKGKQVEKIPFSDALTLSGARTFLFERLSSVSDESRSLIVEKIRPNYILDLPATDMLNSGKSAEISPTSGYVKAGQIIIEKGDLVTAGSKQLLDSYKAEYEDIIGYDGPQWFFWIGNFVIALALISILIGVIFFTNKEVLQDSGRFNYILTIFLIAAISAIMVGNTEDDIAFMVPFTLTGLYLQAFFRNRVIVPVFIVMMIPLLLFVDNGVALFVMFTLAGIVAIYTFRFFGKGWRQFLNALVTFAVLAIVYLGFYACDVISGDVLRHLIYLFVASMLSVAGYPLIYLFEKIFNLVSVSRYAELCDTSNPLLRELESKAPGSFQHSLQVMNMADTVARAVGANEHLVRAGALYHDIGKMMNPMCFVENESMLGEQAVASYHSNLSPLHSAQDIIRHVSDGVEIARKHRLPKPVIDMIQTHHGTTATMFFLNKYLNEGGDPALLSEFHYAGPNPQTKEQIVLMLCDSIEAASRSLKDKNFDEFVEKMVSIKMEAGQFENADITIRELGIVKETLKSYLAQLYHGRIEYPKYRKQQNKS